VLGTLAGDDTILLILRKPGQLDTVINRLEERAGDID
jgi:arginine repressor